MNIVFKILLTINATSWMLIVYIIKEKFTIFSMPFWLFHIALVMLVFLLSAVTRVVALGREKFLHGETHFFKHFAGVFAVGGAFFGGNAEIVNGDKHLNVADKLNDSEKSKRYVYSRCSAFAICMKISADVFVYCRGNTTVYRVVIAHLAKLCRKGNGVNALNYTFRHITACANGWSTAVIIGVNDA